MDRKPGRPRGLTVEVIAQAALDDGVATFSMPSVARRLGVAHSGLYRYVEDRDDLLVRALDLAILGADWPDAGLPWRDLLRGIGETIWQMCQDHHGLDSAALSAPRSPRSVEDRIQSYIETLQSQDFVLEDAAVSVEFVITLALTASAEMRRLQKIEAQHENGPRLPVLKAYDTEEVWRGRGWYARKLDIVLDGLEHRRLSS
ncbi:TetR family transcriptional regulator [Aeromicrobium sp. A1-2]|uniref:TetR/AcrR family transcriptional regulator n=1 Tax=Aeromicrobium sp. A1-2 TaxID=2107713 RepID=UPI000E4C261A|nr:TetR/AcrR family transcriptional regulator [Aeromicrobium sp. A1-2]AXT84053.1 TetR family transcriptional regulator [Aeromicrobium sp. A1-2]